MTTREERIRNRLFPGARTFPRDGGFTTLPLILRRAQFLFQSPRHWQVYTYVMMRTGAGGVAWFNLSEMSWDLDFKSIAKLKPYVDDLVAAGWLLRQSSRGQDYYLVPDPLDVLAGMHRNHKLPDDRVEEIDALAELLDQPTLTARANAASSPVVSTVAPVHSARADTAEAVDPFDD